MACGPGLASFCNPNSPFRAEAGCLTACMAGGRSEKPTDESSKQNELLSKLLKGGVYGGLYRGLLYGLLRGILEFRL